MKHAEELACENAMPPGSIAYAVPGRCSSCTPICWHSPSYYPPPLHREVQKLHRHRRMNHSLRQLPHGLPVCFVESPQGFVVWMLPPCQPQVRYLVTAGCLQLPTRANLGHESVQPDVQQCPRMVGWSPHRVSLYLHAKLRPALPIQRVHELSHEPRWVI